MRENTKWIMLVTALAFVALMVFEWGMDMTGQSAGGLGEIGQVNRTPIMYDEYQATYRQLYDQAQSSQEGPITSQQVRDIEDRAFDEVVNRILIEQELERRGIEVTDEEILQAARVQPPREVQQLFADETGAFNLQQYQQYIASPGADPAVLQYIENYFRDAIPRAKLLRQVAAGVYLTDQELWEQWRDRNERVEVSFASLDPSLRVPDTEISIAESEIEAYYREHESDFEQPSQATVKAVVMRKAPTAADTVASAERARAVAEELREGASWDDVAARESADELSAPEGGDLGVIPRGNLVPAFDTAAFEGPVGSVQDPVRSPYGWHVIQVEERWATDSAHVRHVLIPIERTDDSEIRLLTMADSLEDLSETRSLDEAARLVGLEAIETRITDQLAILPGAGQIGEGADWVFEEAAPGEVSLLFENAQAYYALEVVQSTPRRILTLEEARPTITQVLSRRKKLERAREEGRAIVQKIQGGTAFAAALEEAGLTVRSAGPFTRMESVPGLGRQNAAVGAAFGLELGEVSDVVTTADNAFIVRQTGYTAADSAAWEDQKKGQREQLVNLIQQQRLQEWLDGLRASATIVDRRAQVLQPAEDQPLRPQGGFGF